MRIAAPPKSPPIIDASLAEIKPVDGSVMGFPKKKLLKIFIVANNSSLNSINKRTGCTFLDAMYNQRMLEVKVDKVSQSIRLAAYRFGPNTWEHSS